MSKQYQVNEARRMGVCRICGERITGGTGFIKGWEIEFGEKLWPPPAVTLKFGAEFAHTKCLRDAGELEEGK